MFVKNAYIFIIYVANKSNSFYISSINFKVNSIQCIQCTLISLGCKAGRLLLNIN